MCISRGRKFFFSENFGYLLIDDVEHIPMLGKIISLKDKRLDLLKKIEVKIKLKVLVT